MTDAPIDTAKMSFEEQLEKWKACDDRYVRNDHFWNWIAIGVCGIIVSAFILIFTLTRWGSAMEQEDTVLKLRVARVENAQIQIGTVLTNQDTIKTYLKKIIK